MWVVRVHGQGWVRVNNFEELNEVLRHCYWKGGKTFSDLRLLAVERLPTYQHDSSYRHVTIEKLDETCKLKGVKPFIAVSSHVGLFLVLEATYAILGVCYNHVRVLHKFSSKMRPEQALKYMYDRREQFLKRLIREIDFNCIKCNAHGAFGREDANYCRKCGLPFKEHLKMIVSDNDDC